LKRYCEASLLSFTALARYSGMVDQRRLRVNIRADRPHLIFMLDCPQSFPPHPFNYALSTYFVLLLAHEVVTLSIELFTQRVTIVPLRRKKERHDDLFSRLYPHHHLNLENVQSSTAHLPRPCITLAICHPHRLLEQCPSLPPKSISGR
jgi:hypothetical protein